MNHGTCYTSHYFFDQNWSCIEALQFTEPFAVCSYNKYRKILLIGLLNVIIQFEILGFTYFETLLFIHKICLTYVNS